MILLLLTGCARLVFDARVWPCEEAVTLEPNELFRLSAADEEAACEARVEGLSGLVSRRDSGNLFLTGADDVVLRGDSDLYTNWPDTGAAIRVDRSNLRLDLDANDAGLLYVDDTVTIACAACTLEAEVYLDFELLVSGTGHSKVCIRGGEGTITFGSGVMEIHGRVENVEVLGSGVLLTSQPGRVSADVPVVGYIQDDTCGGER